MGGALVIRSFVRVAQLVPSAVSVSCRGWWEWEGWVPGGWVAGHAVGS
jgi:hypothetical protein